MEKKKLNADDLEEIISGQLAKLTSNEVDEKAVYVADAVANQVGKGLKLAALRMKYVEFKNTEIGKGVGSIQLLEPRPQG